MQVHFVGIGGIGVSALAKYYLSSGAAVSGSDLVVSEITDELKRLGVAVSIGKHKLSNIPKTADLVIHTPAISKDNPEILEAKKRKLKIKSYPEAVGELTKRYKTITVSGSHGKSTTTAMTALVLEEGYCDPTVIIGTKVKDFGNSNFRRGASHYFLLEADEWNKSFLSYAPEIAAVTNIDAEHLDTYKTVRGVERAFEKYLAIVPAHGAIIANRDDERLSNIAKKFGKKVRWYSRMSPEAHIVRNILRIPGEHNVSNALAALTVGRTLGIAESAILKAISSFRGTWRRFDFQGMVKGAYIFNDYGHHPKEIIATLEAARERFPFRRIWCVYQPHQYQRLAYLWDDFVTAFDLADRICMLPVYGVAGRERRKDFQSKFNSKKLTHILEKYGKDVVYLDSFESGKKYIESFVHPGDIILMMGAGNIYSLSLKLGSAAV